MIRSLSRASPQVARDKYWQLEKSAVQGSAFSPIMHGLMLQARKIAFDILSRGYGRSSMERSWVDENGSPEDFGDEPLLMAANWACP